LLFAVTAVINNVPYTASNSSHIALTMSQLREQFIEDYWQSMEQSWRWSYIMK